MTFMQLAIRNVMRNRRAFLSYYFSSLFSVLVFFVFSLLYYHPQLSGQIRASSQTVAELAEMGMLVGQVVIVLLSFVFLWFSFSVFLHGRRHDLAVYLMLGASERQIRRLLMVENMLVGLVSIVSGLGIGMLFSKLVLLVSQRMLFLEDGLRFYVPSKSIVITFSCFLIIFMLISFFSTIKISHENLADLSKSGERPKPQPQPSFFLSAASLGLTLFGYGVVVHFAKNPQSAWELLSGVLFTVAGTYLLFHQLGIRFLLGLKKKNFYLKGNHLIIISELIFRIKDNATMFFLISVVAASAFVGIGTTMVLGGESFAETQAQSVTLTYAPYYYLRDKNYHDQNLAKITKMLAATNQTVEPVLVQPIWEAVSSEKLLATNQVQLGGPEEVSVNMIAAKQYNAVARLMDLPEVHFTNNYQAITFPRANAELKKVKALSASERKDTYNVLRNDQTVLLDVEMVDYLFNVTGESVPMMVVADEFYAEGLQRLKADEAEFIKEQLEEEATTGNPSEYPIVAGDFENNIFVFEVKDWQQYGKVFNQISQFLTKEQDAAMTLETETTTGEMTRYFNFSSLYQTWITTKQSNGLILMTSCLLGAVFFTFAACIVYFRLFGDLDREIQRQKTLRTLGISQKTRQRTISQEMSYLFFLPVIVAAIHFFVAFVALQILVNVQIWDVYFKILGCFFVFQILFYLVCRYAYLRKIQRQVSAVY